MIKKIKIDEINIISRHIWEVYQNKDKRTTPPYQDATEVEAHLRKAINHKSSHVLGIYIKDILKGVFLIFEYDDGESFGLQGPYIENYYEYKEIASDMMNYIEVNFKGYKCYAGTTKPNLTSQKFFEFYNFLCTDDDIQMSVTNDTLVPIEIRPNIQLLPEERMEEYKEFHDTLYHDYYWLSKRIYNDIDRWKVHIVLENNKIVGSIFTMKQTEHSGEVYGCKVVDEHMSIQVMSELFYVSSKSWIDEGLNKILNFVPEGIESQSAALVGYRGYDTYMCFFKERI